MSSHEHVHHKEGLAADVTSNTGVPVNKCYQCGKCSAGCPVAFEMDYPPSMVLRMLQTESKNNDEKLLKSNAIWLCVSCEMCYGRCPMEIDIPVLMDYLRQRAYTEKKVNPKAHNIVAFHKAFLNSINQTGRLYEVGLVMDYKMRTGALMQDVEKSPKMFIKGKLSLIPEMIKDKRNIKNIFNKTLKNKKS